MQNPNVFPGHEPLAVVLACSFDPTVLSGPLTVWLERLTGLPTRLQYVGFGATLEALRNPQSAWNANQAGVNVLVARLCDLEREGSAEAALRAPPAPASTSGVGRGGADDGASGANPDAATPGSLLLADALSASLASCVGRTIILVAPPPEACTASSPAPTGWVTARVEDGCADDDGVPAWLSARASLLRRSVHQSLAGCRGLILLDEAQALRALREAGGGRTASGDAPTPAAAGGVAFYSPFLDRVAHAPFSPAGASALAALVTRALARACAPTRKVLALDCDNTLWGGAVAELGARGVDLSGPWLAAQRLFVAAQRRGLLLVLVSRNRAEDVRAVLRERASEMALREEHVVAVCANWEPKSRNLRALAEQLCLGLGSFVFIDDSAAECAEVAQALLRGGACSLAVVQLPRDAAAIPSFLSHCWTFDPPMDQPTRSLPAQARQVRADGAGSGAGGGLDGGTQEDAARTRLYRELAERKTFLARVPSGAPSDAAGGAREAEPTHTSMSAASSPSAFLASLNLLIDISPLAAETAERAAQLTDRTNQHNACRSIARGADLLRLARGPAAGSAHVLTVRASDRFGDHGLIGLVVFDRGASVEPRGRETRAEATAPPADTLHVRAWSLSCRSLHLGIEFAMLRRVAEAARAAGATQLAVHWVRAERNEPAAAFLFSVPGARFVPAPPEELGLPLQQGRGPRVDSRNGWVPSGQQEEDRQARATAAAAAAAALVGAGAAAARAAVVASVESICAAGARLETRALPSQLALAALSRAERRALARWAAARLSRERRGSLSLAAARSASGLVARGWIGGEICRHHAAGQRCGSALCPFAHPLQAPVEARLTVAPDARATLLLAPASSHGPLAEGVAADATRPAATAAEAAVAEAEREAELHAERTFGDVARYECSVRERPASGYVVIGVEEAAALKVGLLDDPRSASAPATADAACATGASGEAAGPAEQRRGWANGGSLVLHYETYREIADALSSRPAELHAWVSSECERTLLVPRPYAEAWELVLQRELELGGALAAAGDSACGEASPGDGGAAAVRAQGAGARLHASTLATEHARLRRQIRHAMHLMMQQSNPQSYYAGVKHVCS